MRATLWGRYESNIGESARGMECITHRWRSAAQPVAGHWQCVRRRLAFDSQSIAAILAFVREQSPLLCRRQSVGMGRMHVLQINVVIAKGEWMRIDINQEWKPSRQNWTHGPWDNEPDFDQFKCHEMTCALIRSPLGSWCGYVGVDAHHPLFGCTTAEADMALHVHGGVTFTGIGRNHRWLIGFDCAHAYDLIPSLPASCQWGEYKSQWYAEGQARYLAQQLDNLKLPPRGAK
jgi:hypothetical protein